MSEDPPQDRLSTDELFRRHAPFVARMLYRLGVAAAELDDVLQEVFIVVHRHGGYVRGPATPTSYLANIAIKAAASSRRRDRTRRNRQSPAGPEDLASPTRTPVQLLEVRDEAAQLESALAELEPDLRALLVLADLEGESCIAIAASQGIPVGTLYWRLHRARRKFQEIVRRRREGSRAQALSRVAGRSS